MLSHLLKPRELWEVRQTQGGICFPRRDACPVEEEITFADIGLPLCFGYPHIEILWCSWFLSELLLFDHSGCVYFTITVQVGQYTNLDIFKGKRIGLIPILEIILHIMDILRDCEHEYISYNSETSMIVIGKVRLL